MIRIVRKAIFFLSALSAISLHAGAGLDLTVWALADGNAFRNYETLGDRILQPNLVLYYNQLINNFTFQIYYSGSGAVFEKYPQRRFLYQTIGMKGGCASEEARFSLNWGGEFDFRTNEAAYAYYEYNQKSAYANLRAGWTASAATFAGLSAVVRTYNLLSQFDFDELSGFVRQNVYLPTRTTLIGSVTIGRKRFAETVRSDAIEAVEDMTDPEKTRGGNGRNGNGQGKGNNGKRGSVVSYPDPAAHVRSVYVSMEGRTVTRVLVTLRAAQSVTRTTGIAAEIGRNRSISGRGRYISYQDGGYEEDDLLFDDPYNYDSDALLIELTQILPFSIQLKAGYQTEDKRYFYPALDMEGGLIADNRSDRKHSVRLQFSRAFPGWIRFRSLRLLLACTGYWNRSNDPFYTYSGYTALLGWQIQL